MSTIKVILGDCMEVMVQYEPKYFDLAVVDPPYGIGEANEKRMLSRHHSQVKYAGKDWDKEAPFPEYFDLLNMKCKNYIIWGANHFIDNIPFNVSTPCWIVWDKDRYGDFADGEMAITNFKTALRIFKHTWDGFRKQTPEDRIHPTQKPVALYDWIYAKYLPEGGKVLDTHGGSMSNVISWIKAGNIDGVCTEIDPDYFHDAKKRIQVFLAQQDMFRNPVTVEFIGNKMSMK